MDRQTFSGYFREVQPKFARVCTVYLSRVNLTIAQFGMLSVLLGEGIIPMTELSSRLHISKPAVTHLVDRLEKRRCLRRIPHAKDRRISLIRLEPRGEKIVRAMQSAILKFLLQTFDQFGTSQQKTVIEFYRTLSRNMDSALSKP